MKKVVITGATSMIGLATLRSCLKHDVSVIYAVLRENSFKKDLLPNDERIKVVFCNANDYHSLPEKIDDTCDTFYHFAWSLTGTHRNENIDEQAKNILFTLDALDVADKLGCSKFIGAGSQAEYGKLDVPAISPDSPCNPIQPYGIAKYAAGRLVMEKAKQYDIKCFWVRIFSVYGIGEKQCMLIPSTIKLLKEGKETAFTPGTQRWDFLFSEDAGDAFFSIGQYSTQSKVYCLGSGKARPLKEYLEMIRDIVSPDCELGFGKIPFTENTVMNLCADISALSSDTNWSPKTEFSDGIKSILNYS